MALSLRLSNPLMATRQVDGNRQLTAASLYVRESWQVKSRLLVNMLGTTHLINLIIVISVKRRKVEFSYSDGSLCWLFTTQEFIYSFLNAAVGR